MSDTLGGSKHLPRIVFSHVEASTIETTNDTDLDVVFVHGESNNFKTPPKVWSDKFQANTKFYYCSTTDLLRWIMESECYDPTIDASDVWFDRAVEDEHDESATRPLVWVAQAPDARAVYKSLHEHGFPVRKSPKGKTAVFWRTYGVIELQPYRPSLIGLCIPMWGQWSCFMVLQDYYACRNSTTPCRSDSMLGPNVLHDPSDGVFMIVTLLYSFATIVQYQVNREDYYQQLCLIVGLAAGLLLSPSIPFTVPGSPVSVHTFVATTSVALACSAIGHWIWRTYFSTLETRLERRLLDWKEEARQTANETHAVEFHRLT